MLALQATKLWLYGSAMPTDHTSDPPLRRLADHLLDGKLDDFVLTRRAEGMAWRLIEREIWVATDGQVDVTFETLRNWYAEDAA